MYTSVKMILSSNCLSSLSRPSVELSAVRYCSESMYLSHQPSSLLEVRYTYCPMSLISRDCLKNTLFSDLAHSIFSFVTFICNSLADGGKKSIRVRTVHKLPSYCIYCLIEQDSLRRAVLALAICDMNVRESETSLANSSHLLTHQFHPRHRSQQLTCDPYTELRA
jgi:hypothetical protein